MKPISSAPRPTHRPAATRWPDRRRPSRAWQAQGGGKTGTLLLSPFIRPGTVSTVPYNHYSTLATIEDLFGLAKLGQAATTSATFGPDIFASPTTAGA